MAYFLWNNLSYFNRNFLSEALMSYSLRPRILILIDRHGYLECPFQFHGAPCSGPLPISFIHLLILIHPHPGVVEILVLIEG